MADEIFYPKGEYIFREGESADYAYVLQSGSIEICKTGIDGEVVLATLTEPNALFGEMALIDGAPRSAGARAGMDTKVTEVRQNDFLAYVQKNPAAAMNIMNKLSTELREANKVASASGGGDEISSGVSELETDVTQTPEDIDDTDAIYDTPASMPVILTVGTVLVGFLVAFLFSFSQSVETTVSSRGKFTTEVPNVDVQASSSATVRKVMVKRGQQIKKGQLVVLLDSTVAEADLKSNTEKLNAVVGRLRRLKLEQKLIVSKRAIPNGHKLNPLALDILSKRLGQYRSKMTSFGSKLKKIDKELATARGDVKSAQKTVDITKKQFELKQRIESARKQLYDSKHGSMLSYLQSQDATLAARRAYFGAIDAVDSKRSAMTAKLSDRGTLKADMDEFVAKWSSGLGESLSKEQESYIQLRQSGLKLNQNVENVEVRAPVDGVVLDLPTISEGSIVKEGDRLITLVLVNQPLTLEVDVDPKDISDVKIDIPVSVKLDALPFQQYGDLKGNLIYISEDTYDESLSGDKGAFYRGRVDIPPKELATLPPGFRLTPGMLANADMRVGERKVLTYLIHPILKGFSSAFREPD
ncbi:MAG: HlyD family type I secretion periplasmic adaptor subunit [Pseudomonadota bacterium]|nr:HlyD family type I secretion periplasmic adaptor subunit [Pseudomonadota bacterium]